MSGAAIFLLLLAVSCLKPEAIASWARQADSAEVRQRAAAYTPDLGDLAKVRAAARVLRKHDAVAGEAQSPAARLQAANARTSEALIREVRIFSGATALVFLLLGLMAWFWTRDTHQLVAPEMNLTSAALLVGCMYAFSQDWLKTILMGNYFGLWYFPYLLVTIGFMLDMVYNRGRISQLVAIFVIDITGIAGLAVTGALG